MRFPVRAALVGLIQVAGVAVAHAQLVNPSFEDGLTGWTVSSNSPDRTQVVVLAQGQSVPLGTPVFDFDVGMMTGAIRDYAGLATDGTHELALDANHQLASATVSQEVMVPAGAVALAFDVGYMTSSSVQVVVVASGAVVGTVGCTPTGCGPRMWRTYEIAVAAQAGQRVRVVIHGGSNQFGSGIEIDRLRFAIDTDHDAVSDATDNCPAVANADQADGDGDGRGDACDTCRQLASPDQTDSDGDGAGDLCDDCPAVADPAQADVDGDGVGDACDVCPGRSDAGQLDGDGDGLGDECDLCPAIAGAPQTDADADNRGDACDNCPTFPNEDQGDFDHDGAGDECDNCQAIANATQADADHDGLGDACDVPGDDDDGGCSTTSGGAPASAPALLGAVALILLARPRRRR